MLHLRALQRATMLACVLFLVSGCVTFTTTTTPAVEGFSDEKVYVAAVSPSGNISYRTLSSPEVSTGWSRVSDSSNDQFALDTAPVLLTINGRLHLFARGTDNEIWVSLLETAGWSNWSRQTNTGDVAGRFSVAVTSGGMPFRTQTRHFVYRSTDNTVRYRRLFNGLLQAGGQTWAGGLDGTIAKRSDAEVAVTVRFNDRFEATRFESQNGWAPSDTATLDASLGTEDLSNTLSYRNQYHVFGVLTRRADDVGNATQRTMEHLRFFEDPNGVWVLGSQAFQRHVSRADPFPVLTDYRNKLVVAYLDGSGVYYARWDNTDNRPNGSFAWVGRIQAGGSTFARPALGLFQRSVNMTESWQPNYRNEIFLAVKAGRPKPPVIVSNFTHSIFRKELTGEFSIFDNPSDLSCDEAKEDWLVEQPLVFERRPFLSEAGYLMWTMPAWISASGHSDVAEAFCESGQWDAANTGGRVEPPCEDAAIPFILKPSSNIYICQGAWNPVNGDYLNFFQEFGHYTIGFFLGFRDDGQLLPLPAARPPNGPTGAEYLEAGQLFSDRVNGARNCTAGMIGTRCVGFTGFAGNYDVTSIQHSMMYVWYLYIADGDSLRASVAADLAVGDDLLERKYEWIKEHIFQGEEFRRDSEPLVP